MVTALRKKNLEEVATEGKDNHLRSASSSSKRTRKLQKDNPRNPGSEAIAGDFRHPLYKLV